MAPKTTKAKAPKSGKGAIGKILKHFGYSALEDCSALITDGFEDPYKGAMSAFMDINNYLTPDPESGLKQAVSVPDPAKQLVELLLCAMTEDIVALKLNSNDKPDKLGDIIAENSPDIDNSFVNFLYTMPSSNYGDALNTATDSETYVMSVVRQRCPGISNDIHQWMESKFIDFMKNIAFQYAALWWFATSRSMDVGTINSIVIGMGVRFEVLQRATTKIVYPVKKPSTKKKAAVEAPADIAAAVTEALA